MKNNTPNPLASNRRRWLRSASIMAAATAMIAGNHAASAQSRPSGVPSPVSIQSRAPVQILNARAPGVEGVDPAATVNTRPLPTRDVMARVRGNPVAPSVQELVSINPAPAVPVIRVPATVRTRSVASAGTVSVPRAAATADGISVNASASFDDTAVAFRPSVSGDTVELLGTSAIIDWTTFDSGSQGTQVTFLGSGQALNFTGDTDFTVLNRITTPLFDSAIRIDGAVNSTVDGGALVGGNVWFSSAGGIVIGSTSTFNVGSLLLSTSTIDPNDVALGDLDVNFLGVSDSASSIIVESGASITASNNNSYVAFVAPRIEQRGNVSVNGSVAYVAAEEATLTIQNSLFDISVSVGSEDENGILHAGSTGGAASTSAADEQAIYFVAVPKNDALTMLLSGSIGYEPAASANVENGKIILTNSRRVQRTESFESVNGQTQEISSNTVDTSELGSTGGNIDLRDLNLGSSVQAVATDTITVAAQGGGDQEFDVNANGGLNDQINLELVGGNAVDLSIIGTGNVDVSGNLTVTSGDGRGTGGSVGVGVGATAGGKGGTGGGQIPPGGNPGGLTVGGDIVIDARGRGLDDAEGVLNNGGQGIGGDGVAGDISITIASGATLSAGGDLILDASANGGRGSVQEGAATGGSAVLALSDGSLSVGGDLVLDAQADRAGTLVSSSLGISGNLGSSSTGGSVSLILDQGSADIQRVSLNASALASSGLNDGVAQSNEGNAGSVDISVSGGFYTVDSIDVDVTARAQGRIDDNGVRFIGDATRGSVSLEVFEADSGLIVNNGVFIDASVISGVVSDPVGDTVSVVVADTGSGTGSGLNIGGDLDILAGVSGGQIGSTMVGGAVRVEADNGNLFTDGIFISSEAGNDPFSARRPTEATDFRGGDISILATNGGTISSTGFSSISSTGLGQGEATDPGLGIGQGGTVTLLADNATLQFTETLSVNASGFSLGGANSNGEAGQGLGGTLRITVQGDNGILAFADLRGGTNGTFSDGGDGGVIPFAGAGSTGQGGLTEFNVLGGTLTAVDVEVSSDGIGGTGGELPTGPADPITGLAPLGNSGDGLGGQVVFNLNGGTATVANLDVTANGRGGSGFFGGTFNGTTPGDGGDAAGGEATFNALAGSLTVTGTLSVAATGNQQFSSGNVFGGRGGGGSGAPGGDGGDAQGGTATFNLNGNSVIDANAVVISTQAFGGEGGTSDDDFNGTPDQGGGLGGSATGGNAFFVDTAGDITFGSLTVNASGVGGIGGGSFGQSSIDAVDNGGAGGDGVGGLAQITLNQDDVDPKSYSVISQGVGGEGGVGARGGDGGLGQGGTADLIVNADVIFDALSIDASAIGGQAGFSEGAVINNGADGGDAVGGTAQLRVSGPDASFAANSTIGLLASATGGQGGDGAFAQFGIPGPAGDGGTGGTATGGSAFVVAEDGASISINPFQFSFGANATGGGGGQGGGNFFDDDGGDGGAGGDATGGSLGFVANTGANLVIDPNADVFALSAEGLGGAGGSGGDASGSTANAGIGGDGGTGTGGAPLISATGASILAGDIDFFADGTGGNGGLGGQNANIFAQSGLGGAGTGGTPTIEAIEGSPGIVTLGGVSINASGTGGTGSVLGLGSGGQVTISDSSTDPMGLISFGDLTVSVLGEVGTDTGLLSITSNSGPITVTNGLDVNVTGAINIAMENDGQLVINPNANIFSPTTLNATGDITISHVSPSAGIVTLDAGNSFTAVSSGGAFNSENLGDIVASTSVSITAEDIFYNSITSARDTQLTATTGSITGTSDGIIRATGVIDAILLDAAQDVTFGTLISENDGFVTVQAGADITGGSVDAIEAVDLDAGGTIAVDLIDATRAIDGVGQVLVDGGALDLGTINAQGLVNLTSTLGDVAIDSFNGPSTGTINSAAAIVVGTVVLGGFQGNATTDFTANSVTTTGGFGDLNIQAGGTAAFNILNSNRGTQIRATDIAGGDITSLASVDLAVPGSISIGDLATTASANVVITTDAGDITTGQIDVVQGLATINSGRSGEIGGIDASATVRVETANNLTIGNVSAGSNGSLIVGGDLSAGDLFAATTSPGLSLNILGDADVASAGTNGVLNVDVTGALTGGEFSGSITDIDAGSIDLAGAAATGFGLNVDSPGSISLGDASAELNAVINGASVNIDNGTLSRSLTVTSDTGDITGLGSITVANTATFTSAANIAIGSLEATTIALTANGGDLQFNDLISPNTISIQATGLIGATTPGQGNINSGGAVDIDASAIDLGNVISDTSITANASVGDASFGDLNAGSFINIVAIGSPSARSVTSVDDTSLTGASVALNGGDVGGSLLVEATVGDITLAFDGAQQLLVGGAATFNSVSGMIVTHTNNTADTLSVDVGGGVSVNLGGSFNSGAGSILNALGEISLFASGDITANDLRTGPGMTLTAGGNVTLNNATATGPQGSSNFRGILIDAGLNNATGLPAYDTLFDATITGVVTSYADITINAGGSAIFDAASSTTADNALFVTTGDDIIVRQGASVASANNPTDPIDPTLPFDGGPNLVFEAGSLASLLTTPQTPIASIVLDGTLNANEASIILDANAIEGLDSSLIAGSIKADVRDAPATGSIFSDDNGLLIAPCLEGSVCLGNMDAQNVIEIGLDSNSDVISLFIEQAEVSATDISIQTRNDIVMGTNGINTTLDATGTFSATSVTGDVNLQDAEISADQILIDAAGSLLGTGVLTSANDIGVTVGDSIIAGGIVTDGELTTVAQVGGALEGFYTVSGDFILGEYSQGSSSIDVSADGNIDIGSASSPGDVFLSAAGSAFLGFANVPGDIVIDGAGVGYTSLDASNVLISGGSVSGGDVFSGGDVDISGDDIDVGNIDAVNTVSVLGSRVAVGEVSANDIGLTSDSDILFNRLDSANAIALDAASGTIASNGGAGDIISDGDVTLDALNIAIGGVSSQGSVVANATDGDASFGVVDAVNDITITASGSPSVLNAISGGSTTITGSSVSLDNGMIGADLTLLATAGDIDGNGSVTVGGAIDFSAPGNIGFGDLTAQGGSFEVDAGGDIVFTGATSTDFINLTAIGSVAGGDLNATNDVNVDAGDIAVGAVIADQISLTSATNILFNLVQSPNAVTLTANGGAIGANTGPGDIITDGAVNLLGLSIDVGQIDAGSNVTAEATDGDLGTGAIAANGAVTLDALSGAITTGDIEAASNISAEGASINMGDIRARGSSNGGFDGGVINLDATGDIALGDATSSGNFTINAGGNLDFANIVVRDRSFTSTVGGAVTGGGIRTLARDGTRFSQSVSVNADGDITLSGAIDTDDGVSLISSGAISAQDLTGAVGDGLITVRATDAASVGNITSGGQRSIGVSGSTVATGAIMGGGTQLTASAGGVSVNGDVSSDESVAFTATQDIIVRDVTGAGVTINAGGDVEFSDLVASNSDLIINAGGSVTGSAASRSSANTGGVSLFIDSEGDVDVDALSSGNNTTVNGDTVAFTTLQAGGNTFVEANTGDITAQSLSAGGTAEIDANDGAIAFGVLTAADANLTANGVVSVEEANVSGLVVADGTSIDIESSITFTLDANATDGDVNASSDRGLFVDSATATGDVNLDASNSLEVTEARGTSVDLVSSGGTVELLGTVDAVDTLSIRGSALSALDGSAVGETIEIITQSIDIGPGGFIGDATRTQSITFDFRGDGRVGGGSTDLGGFELDNTELARVFSGGDINFNALNVLNVANAGARTLQSTNQSSGGSDITIGDLNVIAGNGSSATGQNIGQNGVFSFSATGNLSFAGNVTISNASADTVLAIDAANLVHVNAATGGLFVLDTNEGLAGQIEIRATDFIAATDQAFTDIDGLSVTEIDERLADNDGVDRPDGIIRANSLDIATTASQVFIQNTASGTDFDDRRGFEVNSLSISSGGGTGSLQPIVINGTVDGVTGIDAIALTGVASPADPASTINGCVIADPASCVVTVTPPPTSPPPTSPPPTSPPPSPEPQSDNTGVQTRDLIEDGLEPETVLPEGFLQDGLIDLNPDTAFDDDPLIDDPVTGAGNEDLWVNDEECEEGAECAA
ncbi:MAG: hypothetical protein AAF251_01315 [Pseudomonadota bacterium]